ncbi:MAG: hypothetical protein PWQ96_429 [Clostridia bacterium]|nr:hypothetical protein [Clostridia bacterium]
MHRDSIIYGVLAGLTANFIKLVVAWIGQFMGWLDYMFVHFALGLFMPQEFVNNPLALFLGYVTDFANGALLGVLLVYIFRLAGKDYGIIKGAIYGILIHVILYGGIIQFNVTNIYEISPLPNFVILVSNTIFGIVAAWFIERYYNIEQKAS